MCELKRIIENDHCFSFVNGRDTRCFLEILFPCFMMSFILISTIAETFYGVNVERILTLTNDSFPFDNFSLMYFMINFSTIIGKTFLNMRCLFSGGEFIESSRWRGSEFAGEHLV